MEKSWESIALSDKQYQQINFNMFGYRAITIQSFIKLFSSVKVKVSFE